MAATSETGVCPHPGCTARTAFAPGVRCPSHDRPLIPAAVAERHADDPLLGRTIQGDFDLIGIIGRGAMGAVYRGWQRSQGRAVAVKVISGKAVQALDEPVKRFVMEARALAAMPQHPAIVGIYDYGEDAGLLYMVLELVEGPSLKAFSNGRRLPGWQVADIAMAVLGALGEAHEAGVVHRDLKPSNVVMCSAAPDETRAKVLDFGVAKVFWPDDQLVQEVVTRAGMALGTPKYMSPEQARGKTVGPGSDLYALGVMLYRLLAGKLPFEGDNDLKILKAHILHKPPPWPDGAVVDPQLDAFVRRLLEKRPADRFPDAPTAARALAGIRPALGGPGARRADPGWPGAADFDRGREPSSQQVAAEMGLDPRPPGGGQGWRTGLFVAAAIGLGVGVGLLALSLAPEPDAPSATIAAPAEPEAAARVTVGSPPRTADDALREAREAARQGDLDRVFALLSEALDATDDPAAMREAVQGDMGFEDARTDPRIADLLRAEPPKP